MNYKEPDTTSGEEVSRKRPLVKPRAKPGASGPSDDRIKSQNNKTVHPTQRLLPIKLDTPITSSTDKDNSDAATEPYEPTDEDEMPDAPKGAFKITVKSLKKTKNIIVNIVINGLIAQRILPTTTRNVIKYCIARNVTKPLTTPPLILVI